MKPLLVLVVAYLVGGIPFGFLLVKLKTGEDVRSKGSGNIGATNVLRTTGRAIAVVTLLLDIGKGFFAVWFAGWLTGDSPEWMSAAALAVMAGHAYPVFLRFHGGKAVASFVGAFLYLTPVPLAATLVLFVFWPPVCEGRVPRGGAPPDPRPPPSSVCCWYLARLEAGGPGGPARTRG